NGNGTFGSPINMSAGTNPLALAVGDVDRDGSPDLAVANFGGNNVSLLFNGSNPPGTGSFQNAVNFPVGGGAFSVAVRVLTGAGTPALAVANYSDSTVSVLLGNGNGTFQNAVNLTTDIKPQSVAVADLNGDGIPDLVTANLSGSVSVLLGNGNGTF